MSFGKRMEREVLMIGFHSPYAIPPIFLKEDKK